ncbi:HNH endonuclease [Pseudoalteromonas sp. PPB1]|uniref:HNH endonuclease n=1 Tax=Pseudoalteromonas sp. PPB1 TaxID=2756136 RepID=UPI001890F128|nr:HNH endonuclease [Pseudoalteromonas sp. PPB1]
MKIEIDFSGLQAAAARMGAPNKQIKLDSGLGRLNEIDSGLGEGLVLGDDLQLSEIDNTNNLLSYKGRQIMLYIPEQGSLIEEVLRDGKIDGAKRLHVAECKTLENMRNQGRFERYHVTNDISGRYPVLGHHHYRSDVVEGKADLGVCKNCLKILNYKGYSDHSHLEKSKIYLDFNLAEFFETYSSYFKHYPTQKKSIGSYTKDWEQVSVNYRQQQNYTCEQCGVALSDHKRLLHTHHINGVKIDNALNNLKALCVDCHTKQPNHDHMFVSHEDRLLINQLRREQHKFDCSEYSDVLQYADSALEGLLLKCQKYRLSTPELGICIKHGNELVSIDLAWPRKKFAVVIEHSQQAPLRALGWNVWLASEGLANFYAMQKYIR